MRKLLRCRRGSVAFATVVALVPLIGAVALGAEAGSWYVTKQHAQNAADAAAYAGALRLACSLDPSCVDANSVDYRGKEFAARNAFCNAGDISYLGSKCATSLPSGTSQTVQLALLTSWNGTPGNFVQATVSQQQQAQLAAVLGFSTVNIPATAVASVIVPTILPCVLAESGAISFQDASVNINAPNCGLASNGSPIGFNFKTGLNSPPVVGSMSTAGGCSGNASLCSSVSTYNPRVIDPFSALTSAIDNLTLTACKGSTLQPYATGLCANDNTTLNSVTSLTVSGVYFFSGGLSLGGNGGLRTCTGSGDPDPLCAGKGIVTATIIVLPVSGNKTSLKMAGGSKFNITAPSTAPSASAIPSQLSSVANLLTSMALFDPEQSPQTTGTSTMAGSGVFYLPKADPLNWQGSSTGQVSTCTEVIAASITLAGTPNFNNQGCIDKIKLKSQIVQLVQ
ncbi:pilus assembly protein TadG-related protein [Bradyrhizobium sp. Ash2021]|uniref:pilus assembly protein TadG-related protein n=1 Tax=Bradyrhizobium sp. Ash2021 TaxID=2954771 RepID=UPI00281677B1|nr:pilus assembly protein TadG-related protein [Bradyrhizobium sp. Ash2021]WMT78219.1 pilus assembly protein TadG-related protein [Bradyrhizobium sp. Ash2021]